MGVKALNETTELTADDAEFAVLNRARIGMMRVCEACELDSEGAMNVLTNVLVMIAVHECMPREEVIAAVGRMYDACLERDSRDETLN